MASQHHFTQRYSPHGPARVGPHNMGESGIQNSTNVRAFYHQPLNILPHNIYISTQLPLADPTVVTVNTLAYLGLLIASTSHEKGIYYALGGSAALWTLWLLNVPRGTRLMLSPLEFHGFLQ